MKHADLYKGFSPEKQKEYEDWLVAEHGPDMAERIEASKKAIGAMSDAERDAAMAELAELETALSGKMTGGVPPESDTLDDLLGRHRAWVATMWGRDCPPEAYAGLAGMYCSHPDFRARYETIAEGFTEYLASAMKAHAARHQG